MHTVSIQKTNLHFFTNHQIPFTPKATYPIETALNKPLYDFLKEYHPEIEWRTIQNIKENSLSEKGVVLLPSKTETQKETIIPLAFQDYTIDQWKEYIKTHSIDYDEILAKDGSLQEKIYQLFQEDFLLYSYSKENPSSKNIL